MSKEHVNRADGSRDWMIEVRPEESGEIAAIRDVNRRAFGQEQEANIIDALRRNGGVLLSLVAASHGRIVGHILYSPVVVGEVAAAALGPMSVVPECQRHGIGTKLVELGNAHLAKSGCPLILVVGHPEFYARFGFRPARRYGIKCEWDVPDDVFMALPLDATQIPRAIGTAAYRREFSSLE
jgi:putative acetyltransferase